MKKIFENIKRMGKLLFSKAYKESLSPTEYKKQKEALSEFFLNNGLYIAIGVFVLITACASPGFVSLGSITNVINLLLRNIPIALGVAGLVIVGATDLSAGRSLGFTAMIVAALMQKADYAVKIFPSFGNVPIILAFFVAVIVGMIIGAFNGFFVAKFQVHPFIVTLGTQLILQSVALLFLGLGTNNGQSLSGMRDAYKDTITSGITLFGGITIQWYLFYALIVLVAIWFVWNKTVFGKNLFAIGSNKEAARVSGINVERILILTFVLAGALFGINGFIEAGWVGSVNAGTGVGMEFDAIAACVIGGVSFSGGIGKIRGVVVGVLLLQLITVSLIFLGAKPEWGYLIKGLIIIVTVAIDMRKNIKRK